MKAHVWSSLLAGPAIPPARGQDAAPNIMANGDFHDAKMAIDFWDPRKDGPDYDEATLPRIVDSDHPDGGNMLSFPAAAYLQTVAVNQHGLALRRGYNLELTVTYKSPDKDLNACAEVVLQWATWPNIAKVDLKPGEGWQTATVAFKATRMANVLTVAVRNIGAGGLLIHDITVRQLPHDPGQLPQPRDVQPGETPQWTADDTWAFKPGADPYADNTLFDLRVFNDRVAGEKGWIKHDADGNFLRGDGSPIRFWGVGGPSATTEEAMDAQARFLAKRGVNLIRNGTLEMENEDKVNESLRKLAVMKRHGIYSVFTIYWKTDGRLFWDTERQAAYKGWWRKLLTRPNPCEPNQTPLKDDPALAILQSQNEDSWLFWTMWGAMYSPERRAEYLTLNAMFLKWLDDNNITLEPDQATKDWFFADNNYPPESRLDFRFWLAQDLSRTPPESFRLSMRFSAELMRKFNAEIADFIRGEIGCPVLINAGNWQTAAQDRLLDLERWSYDANEVIGVNRYIDISRHVNDNGRVGWLIEPGDHYASATCLGVENWRAFSPNIKQVKGKPTLMPETGWVYPNLYQAEGPILMAAYMSLTGVGAVCWVDPGGGGYNVPVNPYIGGLWKWAQQPQPPAMGGWAAAAWMFHKGYVTRGAVAVDEKRGLEGDLWELKLPAIAEESSFDPNRPGTANLPSNLADGVPFGAFMVGPVRVEYGKDASGTRVDLAGNTPENLNRGIIRSNTGELFFNAPGGLFVLDAPCAQGVAGFLGAAGPQSTGALDIRLENHYAAVLAVSLDGKPLVESGRVLLQITTLARPDGWEEAPVKYESPHKQDEAVDGFRIESVGKDFWNVKNARGTVAIKNANLSKATLADAHFYAAGDVPVARQDGKLSITLPGNAMYVVLE
jgi:hypothetical protein